MWSHVVKIQAIEIVMSVNCLGSIETPQTSTKPPKTTSKHTHTKCLNNFKRILNFVITMPGSKTKKKCLYNCMIYTGKNVLVRQYM